MHVWTGIFRSDACRSKSIGFPDLDTHSMEQNKALDNIENREGFIRLLDAAEIEKTNPFDLMRRFLQIGVSVYADLICVPLPIKTNPTTSDIQQELDKGSIEFGLRGEFWFPGDPTDHESSSVIEKIYLESLKCVKTC